MKIDNFEMTRVSWSQPVSLTAVLRIAPSAAGVYVFGVWTRVMGLDTAMNPFYVGRSINMRKRLGEHYRNQKDLKWRRKIGPEQRLTVVWALLPVSEIEAVEVAAIRTFAPKFNIIHYKTGNAA